MCQVFLTADPALDRTRLPGVGVLHWSDVLVLAERVRGPDSYVARRLRSALERYEEELGASAGRPGPVPLACAVPAGSSTWPLPLACRREGAAPGARPLCHLQDDQLPVAEVDVDGGSTAVDIRAARKR